MSSSNLDRGIASVTSVLLVLAGLMVGIGLVLPSEAAGPPAGYRSLGGPAKPVRLMMPTLGIKAPIKPIEVSPEGALDPPRNARDIGWWQRSARPGAQRGQTVLTGHTVHTGGGSMDRLGKLRPGQKVRISTPKGPMVYRTTRVVTWSKTELSRRAMDIFGQKRRTNRLVMITCTDWNGSSYDSNVVVFAEPLGKPVRS